MRKFAACAISLAALGVLATPVTASDANGNHETYKWVVNHDTSMAPDGSTIALFGIGKLTAGPGKFATGGGTFAKSDGEKGTWTATAVDGFVSYGPAGPEPFPLPPGATGGMAKLRVALDNGQTGVLTIFCILGTPPPSVDEGVHLVLGGGVSGAYNTIVIGNTVFIAM